jgi:hypothetical protein
MSKKTLSKKGTTEVHSQSSPNIPVITDAYATEVINAIEQTVSGAGGGITVGGGGGGISINVNISQPAAAQGGGFGGAAALQHISTGDIVETARSPSHKKRRGNKTENTENEYTVAGGIDETATRKFLTENDWPIGLQTALIQSCQKMPIRFFITDDSGSMLTNDGRRIVGSGEKTKLISCTRWSELSSTLKFHAELAHIAHAPSEFRLLNNAEPVLVGRGDEESLTLVNDVLNDGPGGQTPICAQINEVVIKIREIETSLRNSNQRAAVIICTDGQSTDGDVAEAMRPLQDLPVWVVVRLCTDAEDVIDYWNNIDGELELEMDVLDDIEGEAKEVRAVNDWLFYGQQLHRMREFGAALKEMDLLDEDALSSEQMAVMVSHLCVNAVELEHPEVDWDVFIKAVRNGLKKTKMTWDPIEKGMRPWINLTNLERKYGTNKGSSACAIS